MRIEEQLKILKQEEILCQGVMYLEHLFELIDNQTISFETVHDSRLKHCFSKLNEKSAIDTIKERLLLICFTSLSSIKFNNTSGLEEPFIVNSMERCFACSECINYEFSNDGIKEIGICEKFNEYSFEYSFPSGKLFFCDWPEFGDKLLQLIEDRPIDVNYNKGIFEQTKRYARHNIAHFFVGNSSPRVLKDGNHLTVETSKYSEYEEKGKEDDVRYSDASLDPLGCICTNLWWCTAFDLETFKDILGEEDFNKFLSEETGRFGNVFVGVEPGTYRFSYKLRNGELNGFKYLDITKVEK